MERDKQPVPASAKRVKRSFGLQAVVDIVHAYAIEQKKAVNSENARENIERWVKAHLYDKQAKKALNEK